MSLKHCVAQGGFLNAEQLGGQPLEGVIARMAWLPQGNGAIVAFSFMKEPGKIYQIHTSSLMHNTSAILGMTQPGDSVRIFEDTKNAGILLFENATFSEIVVLE